MYDYVCDGGECVEVGVGGLRDGGQGEGEGEVLVV